MKVLREAWRSFTAEPDVTAIIVLALLFGLGGASPVAGDGAEWAPCDTALIDRELPLDVEVDLDLDLDAGDIPSFGIGPIRFEIR